jgi:hypothetical protein
MDIVFEPNGVFNEVYLYVSLLAINSNQIRQLIYTPSSQEELMEADLHAIVRIRHHNAFCACQ